MVELETWQSTKDLLLLGMGGLVTGTAIWIARSVSTLNVQIAVVIEKLAGHELRLTKLEDDRNGTN